MKLSVHSKNKLMQPFADWNVPKEFADPMYNYLVYGYGPGSGFTSILANDFASAIAHSHPSNTITAYKSLVRWMHNTMPKEAYGSYEKVKAWCSTNPEQRRIILEHNRLIYTNKEEVVLILKDEPTVEPQFW
jgi:Txe/YoeB family toxin of Txe-Axe toxin-antitoxin module